MIWIPIRCKATSSTTIRNFETLNHQLKWMCARSLGGGNACKGTLVGVFSILDTQGEECKCRAIQSDGRKAQYVWDYCQGFGGTYW